MRDPYTSLPAPVKLDGSRGVIPGQQFLFAPHVGRATGVMAGLLDCVTPVTQELLSDERHTQTATDSVG